MPAYYDDWREQQFNCTNCGWQGLGAQLVHGETFQDLFEVDCPACNTKVSVVTFPTLAESRSNWDKVSPADRLIVQHVEQSLVQQELQNSKFIRSTESTAPAIPVASPMPSASNVAQIPVRNWFVDYVCIIEYSESEGVFHFVSARRTDPRKSRLPEKPFDLYLRVLREPALRAMLLEAVAPNQKAQIEELRYKAISEHAKNQGFWLGIAILCIVGYLLYRLTLLLARHVGYDTAQMIIYLPAFFAFLLIFPVQHWYESFYRRRYCALHGHQLETWSDPEGQKSARCKRCGLLLESDSRNAH